jgi:hypothetical protein
MLSNVIVYLLIKVLVASVDAFEFSVYIEKEMCLPLNSGFEMNLQAFFTWRVVTSIFPPHHPKCQPDPISGLDYEIVESLLLCLKQNFSCLFYKQSHYLLKKFTLKKTYLYDLNSR